MAKKKKIQNDFEIQSTTDEVSMVTEIRADAESPSPDELTGDLPIMTLRNVLMFTSIVMPVTVGRQSTLKLVRSALKNKQHIIIATQRVAEVEEPGLNDLFPIAVIGRILRIFELPGGTTTVILQASNVKVKLEEITSTFPYLKGKISIAPEDMDVKDNDEFLALMDMCIDLANQYVDASDRLSPDVTFALKNLPKDHILVNYVCTNFPFSLDEKFELMSKGTLKDRLYNLIQVLNRETKLAELKHDIQMRTREDLDRQQREYFLQQQIKNIQDELGNGQEDEIDELRNKGEAKKWSKEVAATFERELQKLERINPQSPDYNVQLTYLQTLLSLPWNVFTTDSLNIPNAEKVLNKDHYGLEKVKERILEHLAVLKLKGDLKSPILCLYGPPGVGKTSLGRSIASALSHWEAYTMKPKSADTARPISVPCRDVSSKA